jgi:hypothetical protein
VLRVLRARGLVVTAQALPTMYPRAGASRRRLAVAAGAAVVGRTGHQALRPAVPVPPGQSSQLSDRSTALRHWPWPRPRSAAPMVGRQVRSARQLARSASRSGQKPTASPAA